MYNHDCKIPPFPFFSFAVFHRRRCQIKVWAIYLSLANLSSLLQTRGTSKNTFELATNKLLQVASGFSDKRAQARETRIETRLAKDVLGLVTSSALLATSPSLTWPGARARFLCSGASPTTYLTCFA